jgi:hypothetical protein
VSNVTLHFGDCLDILPTIADNSVDSIVTDPPYELGFMGKRWDATGIAYDVNVWRECLRVLKPGGHLLAFGGARTYHRLACAVEDAGFEIRDQIMWIYGSGFPKSLDVSKAIDKAAGAERTQVVWVDRYHDGGTRQDLGYSNHEGAVKITPGHNGNLASLPATPDAARWQGFGTALKPAHEPIIMARKPLIGTVAANVLGWGTGALNIDGCRVEHNEECRMLPDQHGGNPGNFYAQGGRHKPTLELKPAGRWPANLIHDGSAEVVAGFPTLHGAGNKTPRYHIDQPSRVNIKGHGRARMRTDYVLDGSGSAARFFYCAKANGDDRWFFCRDCQEAFPQKLQGGHGHGHVDNDGRQTWKHIAYHPTVKPASLMQYLCRLVTPPGGVVLDPFMGSGSTGKAAVLEGFRFVGIEKETEYYAIAEKRIAEAQLQPLLGIAK